MKVSFVTGLMLLDLHSYERVEVLAVCKNFSSVTEKMYPSESVYWPKSKGA